MPACSSASEEAYMTSTVAIPAAASRATRLPNVTGPILVGTDGTESCDAALRAARVLAGRTGGRLIAVAVLETLPLVAGDFGLVVPPMEAEESRRKALLEAVRAQLVRIGGAADGWSIEVRDGDPAAALAHAGREMKARTIVVGVGHHDILTRVFGAETALRVLRRTRIPVIAVHPEFTQLPSKAVVATDFSLASLRAARAAIEMFDGLTELHLVHVAPVMALQPLEFASWLAVYNEGIPPALERFKAELDAPPSVKVEILTRQGKPAREVLRYAQSIGADLIVSGSRGAGFVDRLLVGSVATGLVRGASCTVLAVPAPSEGDRLVGLPEDMTTIPRELWGEELDAFTKRNLGRRSLLEVDDTDIGAQEEEHDYPFLGAVWDHPAERVEIMLGDFRKTERHLTRGITDVRQIDVVRDSKGRDRILRVAHGNGQTLLTLTN
jgi:nucleotide-binding universal stress UspA family protein